MYNSLSFSKCKENTDHYILRKMWAHNNILIAYINIYLNFLLKKPFTFNKKRKCL